LDITAFIRELLFGHDCVIVPGFGGFIGNYTPAAIDKGTGTFNPPLKLISFNRNLSYNDGLLIKRIAEEKNIEFGDARMIVEDFVTVLRKKLESGEKIVFEKIGSFINNQEGNVQFEPDRSVNYLADSYGLESFQCSPLGEYDMRKRKISHVKDYSRPSSMRKYLWRAAVILPLAGIMVAVSLKTDLFKSGIEATSLNPLVNAEFEYNKAAVDHETTPGNMDLTRSAVNTETPATETTDINPAYSAPVITESRTTNSFFIITGSFRTEAYAGKQADRLREEGFDPEIVAAKNGFYRVCAVVCPDLKTAKSKKEGIIKIFPGAWISGDK
jgi:hypothetical protein